MPLWLALTGMHNVSTCEVLDPVYMPLQLHACAEVVSHSQIASRAFELVGGRLRSPYTAVDLLHSTSIIGYIGQKDLKR